MRRQRYMWGRWTKSAVLSDSTRARSWPQLRRPAATIPRSKPRRDISSVLLTLALMCSFLCPIALAHRSQSTNASNQQCYIKSVAPFLIAILECRTDACLRSFRYALRPGSQLTRLVYFSQFLKLHPGNAEASAGLLRNLPSGPSGRSTYSQLIALGTQLWVEETPAEIVAGGRPLELLTGQAAAAIKNNHRYLAKFLKYGLIAITNPHDRYGEAAETVCKKNPQSFSKAFHNLTLDQRVRYRKYIVDPVGCKQVAFAEAD